MNRAGTTTEDAIWRFAEGSARALFVGRRPLTDRRELLRRVLGIDMPVSWLRQVHGTRTLEARAGCAGEADVLSTGRENLALVISTADCVPIVVASPDRVLAIHAGWRGLAAGILGRAIAPLSRTGIPLTAWIGPAIGPCCYEVGPQVAEQVATACGSGAVVLPREGSNPHLDLSEAARRQLLGSGVGEIRAVDVCTRCDGRLHSYRRDGDRAGRNLAYAWLEG